MPNTAQGLEQPNPAEAVNSEAGFAAVLADRGVKPDEGDAASSDTSIAAGLETVEPGGQPKDPATGRFVSKQAAADTSQATQDTSTEVATPVTSDDPAVADFLAKYNGNVDEALKAATHAQSLLGRRDEERDQLSREVAELRGLVEGLKTATAVSAQPVLSDEQVEELAVNLVSSHGDYARAATKAANDGIQTGDFRVYDSLLDQWLIESPIQAQRFDLDFQLWRREQASPQAAAASDPWVEQQKSQEGITGTMTRLHGEIGADAFAQITTLGQDGESAMMRALADAPQSLVDAIASNDPEERYKATKLVASSAMLLASVAPATPTQEAELEIPASVQRKLSGAGVATAGLRPVAPPAGQPQSKDDAISAFKQEIMQASTTSVADGLTYGK